MPAKIRHINRGARRRGREQDLRLSVEGYKAVKNRQELHIAPLTLISGVNSSGKSSFMQPFLMMKQTLDSAFDPGPLLLYGPNVKVTEYSQMFSRGKSRTDVSKSFSVGLSTGASSRTVTFVARGGLLEIDSDVLEDENRTLRMSEKLTLALRKELTEGLAEEAARYMEILARSRKGENSWSPGVYRNRCFLEPRLSMKFDGQEYNINVQPSEYQDEKWVNFLRRIIHVPGLRGNPERAYQRSAVGSTYPGTFETYVASILFEWGRAKPDKLTELASDLERLGLTWKVMARRVNDASVELMVGRMPHAQQGGARDLVSVADVGFGVSQTLPVLVALRSASRGQMVYIEQPEIHLHPRAQLALADVLVRAAKRGVIVVAETHSSLLIRGIQTAIARGTLLPEQLSLNWFNRDTDGSQVISKAEVDSAGRFGDWPLDFDDISQKADWAYLDAVERSVVEDA